MNQITKQQQQFVPGSCELLFQFQGDITRSRAPHISTVNDLKVFTLEHIIKIYFSNQPTLLHAQEFKIEYFDETFKEYALLNSLEYLHSNAIKLRVSALTNQDGFSHSNNDNARVEVKLETNLRGSNSGSSMNMPNLANVNGSAMRNTAVSGAPDLESFSLAGLHGLNNYLANSIPTMPQTNTNPTKQSTISYQPADPQQQALKKELSQSRQQPAPNAQRTNYLLANAAQPFLFDLKVTVGLSQFFYRLTADVTFDNLRLAVGGSMRLTMKEAQRIFFSGHKPISPQDKVWDYVQETPKVDSTYYGLTAQMKQNDSSR